MRYKRTQVYLDPEDHRWLSEEAERRSISLTALLREIVSMFSRSIRPPMQRNFDSIIGIGPDEPSDWAREEEEYRGEYLDELYEKKMGRNAKPTSKRSR